MKYWILIATIFVTGCATHSRIPTETAENAANWQGRLAVTVHSVPPQAFSADFDLQGDAKAGSLVFYSPLGNTLARMAWKVGSAQYHTFGSPQNFNSLDELTLQATGAELPIASLFEWLSHQSPATPGWRVNLDERHLGRITAQRYAPLPKVDLKLIIHP